MSDTKVGRRTKFNEVLSDRVIELAEQGKTDREIADEIGVSLAALSNWKIVRPEFMESLKVARSFADDLVEASLFQRAIGYSHKAIKWFQHEGVSWSEEYIEHYPPDTTACIFWLKNRRQDMWRDKFEIKGEVAISLTDAMKEARERASKRLGHQIIDVEPTPNEPQPEPPKDAGGETLTLPIPKDEN